MDIEKEQFRGYITEMIGRNPDWVDAAIQGVLGGVDFVRRTAQIKSNNAQLVLCAVSDEEMERVMNRLNPQVIRDLGITSKNYPGWDALKKWEKKNPAEPKE